jgi:hypothetical protein
MALNSSLGRPLMEEMEHPNASIEEMVVDPLLTAVKTYDDQGLIDFIHNEDHQRQLEEIQLNDIEMKELRARCNGAVAMNQLRGVMGRQYVAASRLGWPSKDVLEKTLDCTTQYATHTTRDPSRRWLRKEFGLTHRSDYIVATDPIYVSRELLEETPEINPTKKRKKDSDYYQLFTECGKDTSDEGSGYIDGYAIKNKSDFPIALQNYIRNNSIPKQLWMDGAKEQDSEEVRKLLRLYLMKDSLKSEPYNQHQNPAESKGAKRFKGAWKTISLNSKLTYGFENLPQHWEYQADYVKLLLNHRATRTGSGPSKWTTPTQKSGRPTPDLSMFRFSWGEWVVYFEKVPFPANQIRLGRSLGPSPKGNYLCQRILTQGGQVIEKSAVESVANVKSKGFKLKSDPTTELKGDKEGNPAENQELSLADMMDDYQEASQSEQDERQEELNALDSGIDAIVEAAAATKDVHSTKTADNSNSPTVDTKEEGALSETEGEDAANEKEKGYFYVHSIVGKSDPNGEQVRRYPNIVGDKNMTHRNQHFFEVNWGSDYEGENSFEPFTTLKESSPGLVADYVIQQFGDNPDMHQAHCTKRAINWANAYSHSTGLRRIRIQMLTESGYFDTEEKSKTVERELNGEGVLPTLEVYEDYMNIFKIGVVENARIQYGRRCPRAWIEALRLEKEEGVRWTEAAMIECVDKLIKKYMVFEVGEVGATCPEGYQPIRLKTVYTNGPDNQIKARCCAVGCGVDSGPLNRYFSVVDHSHARAVMTKALADGAELRIVDVKSAYVTCRAQEKVWVAALGPEFGEYAGKSAIVAGNLYGLNTAGAVWAASCRSKLLKMGFAQSAHDRAVYYREITTDDGPEYEYICTYVDDFILASKKMDELVEELAETWEFKHSTNMEGGVRYVGADCKRNLTSKTLEIHCQTYIREALEHIEDFSKEEAKNGNKVFHLPTVLRDTPMLDDDHPETLEGDEAELLGEADTRIYQSYIGALNWCCTLCRIDVEYAVTALSAYNAAPRMGHASRVMRIWGYLKKHPNLGIKLDPTDFFDVDTTFSPQQRNDLQLEYGDLQEEVDPSDPRPLGKALTLTGFADADHAHNKLDRRSTTGRIIFLGRGTLAWKSKRQVGCEGSSYGSELRAMSATATELRGYRMFLRGIGIAVKGPSLLFVDNAAALFAATNLATTLKAKHLSIDYNSVRELSAWGVIHPEKTASEDNLADILTKPTGGTTFGRLIGQLMVVATVGGILLQLMNCSEY